MSVRRPPLRAKKKATARTFAALGAAAFLVAIASDAAADDAQEFEVAKTRFDVSAYAEAVQLFTTMLEAATPPCAKGPTAGNGRCRLSDPDLVERARALDGASLVALSRGAEADAQFEKLLRNNPNYTLSPAMVPPVVIDRFERVKTRLKPELDQIFQAKVEKDRQAKLAWQKARDAEQKWIDDVQRLASQERIVEKSSRVVAMLPFGIGQFQNGDRGYGVGFLVSEVLAGTTSLVSAGIAANYISSSTAAGVNKTKLNAEIAAAQAVNIASFATWATLTVIGIVQAQVAFVPERSVTRPRALPPRPKPPVIAPTVSLVPGGAGLGIAGTF